MDSDGIRIRPVYSDDSVPRARPTGTEWNRTQPGSSSERQEQQPRQKRMRPRKCRICLEVVHPTFVQPAEHVPRMFQPNPKAEYRSEDGGRLLCPCKCKGSNKYVHEGCLQLWRLQDPTKKRNYWSCPTCRFNYKLSRLGWGRFLGTRTSQVGLTFGVFFVTIFLMGFVADPVINFYYNPLNVFFRGFAGGLFGGGEDLRGLYRTAHAPVEERPTWGEHFLKGTAGLGLMSLLKGVLGNPFYYFRFGGGGGGRRTGRDRLNDINWLVVAVGVATFLFATWKLVASWSARVLQRLGERVMDVQNDDDDDDDDGDEFD